MSIIKAYFGEQRDVEVRINWIECDESGPIWMITDVEEDYPYGEGQTVDEALDDYVKNVAVYKLLSDIRDKASGRKWIKLDDGTYVNDKEENLTAEKLHDAGLSIETLQNAGIDVENLCKEPI